MENKDKKGIVFNKYSKLLKITLTAVFSALCFVVMFLPKVYIPSPIGEPYIHLGNLIVILVALLLGGPVGGISGAIGMGVYDLIKGYGIWTIKTIVLKLILGLVVGATYKHCAKKAKNKTLAAIHASTIGVLINVVGEFAGKMLKSMLTGEGFMASVVLSFASLPATFINGIISIVLVLVLFPILRKALSEVSLMNNDKEEIKGDK